MSVAVSVPFDVLSQVSPSRRAGGLHQHSLSCSSAIGSEGITVGAVEESGSPGTGCHGKSTSLSWSPGLALSSRSLLLRPRARTTPCAVACAEL